MWIVEPDQDEQGESVMSVIHLDCILRGAHLIGVAGTDMIPSKLKYSDSLNVFKLYYVNKYIDYHAHEIAFWLTQSQLVFVPSTILTEYSHKVFDV